MPHAHPNADHDTEMRHDHRNANVRDAHHNTAVRDTHHETNIRDDYHDRRSGGPPCPPRGAVITPGTNDHDRTWSQHPLAGRDARHYAEMPDGHHQRNAEVPDAHHQPRRGGRLCPPAARRRHSGRPRLRWSFTFIACLALVSCTAPPALEDLQPAPSLTELSPEARDQIEAQRLDSARLLGPDASEADRGRALSSLGLVYHAYGFLDAARSYYRQALEHSPEVTELHYFLAHAERAAGDLEAADRGFERVLESWPDDPPTLLWLAENAIERAHDERAEGLARRVLEVDPGNAKGSYLLGLIERDRGELAASRDHLEAALERQPAADAIHRPLAAVLARLGESDAARAHAAASGERLPIATDPLLQRLADVASVARDADLKAAEALHSNDYEAARAALAEGVAKEPDNARLRLNYGSMLAEVGDYEAAAAELQRALELGLNATNRSLAWFNLGTIYIRYGQLEAAEEAWERALAADPENEDARTNLETVRKDLAARAAN